MIAGGLGAAATFTTGFAAGFTTTFGPHAQRCGLQRQFCGEQPPSQSDDIGLLQVTAAGASGFFGEQQVEHVGSALLAEPLRPAQEVMAASAAATRMVYFIGIGFLLNERYW